MALIPGTLPSDTCYGTPQDLLELFAQYLSIPAANFQSNVVFNTSSVGLATDIIWFDTTVAAEPILKIYVSGSWVDYLYNYITTRAAATAPIGATDYIPIVQGGTVKKLDPSLIIPTGVVIAWTTGTVPTGFLECDGSAISRGVYASLFSVISTTYGAGNGATTFNIPDYRGQFLRGWAHGQTTDPDRASRTDRGDGTTGDNVGTKQADQFRSHFHYYGRGSDYGSGNPNAFDARSGSSFVTTAAGGNETRPININVMWIIKY